MYQQPQVPDEDEAQEQHHTNDVRGVQVGANVGQQYPSSRFSTQDGWVGQAVMDDGLQASEQHLQSAMDTTYQPIAELSSYTKSSSPQHNQD